MNLVDQIKQQLTSGVIEQLSSVLGADERSTGTAISAAVPAILSALSGLASSNSGAQKLVSALGQFSSGSHENVISKLSSQPASVLEQGTSLLSSLFGGNTISGIVNVLTRFAGIAPGPAQKLLGYLTPMILGTIASRFTGKGVNAQGLLGLFNDQKANIANAMPSGFSLADVPGLSAASSTVRSAAREVEAAAPSFPKWLLPLAGLAALALGLWMFMPSANVPPPAPEVVAPVIRAQSPEPARDAVVETVKPLIPDVGQLKTDVTDTFTKLTEAFSSVKDAATAEAALPTLKTLSGKLETFKTTMKDLGDTGKTAINTLVKASQAKLKELIEKVLAIPGVGDKLQEISDSITKTLGQLSG
jgi:Bacterial protein of unknown function (DUF937)